MSGVLKSSFPAPAEEELSDVLDWDEFLTPNKESSYILKVKSNSMETEGIFEGDMIVVERRAKYKAGQIVIAIEDDGFVLKRMPKDSAKPLKVEAVVTAVIRKY